MLQGGGVFGEVLLAGTHFFAGCVDSVLVFSTSTGEQVANLQCPAAVTALCVHPENDACLYAASKDGRVTLWDVSAGTAVQQWQVDCPIEGMAVVGTTAYLSCQWRQQHAGRLFAYDLAKGAAASGRAKVSSARRIVASFDGQLLATVDRHTALVWQADRYPHKPLVLTHTKALTCATLSAGGDVLAVGDMSGRIVLWHGVRQALQSKLADRGTNGPPELQPSTDSLRVAQATVHWHAEAVCCLAFTPDDTQLLSGGHEGVLVVWDVSSGRRTYLPRLGDCLQTIATCAADPSRVVVNSAGNMIRVVDLAAMQVCCSVRGISCDLSAASLTRMAVQPSTGYLALASSTGSLQFYDPLRDQHVSRLQLLALDPVRSAHSAATQATSAKLLAPTHVVFSADAEVLVTVQQIPNAVGKPRSLVKFWNRSQAFGQAYSLAGGAGCCCSLDGFVKAAALHPQRPLVAVSVDDCSIRFLEVDGAQSVASWATVEGAKVNTLAFSPDGSILAVGSTASNPVHLVDPTSQQTLATLPPLFEAAHSTAGLRLAFLADGLHIVVQWGGGIAVYSIVTGTVAWVHELPTALMSADMQCARFAVSTPRGSMAILNAQGPLGEAAGLLHGLQVHAAQFLPPYIEGQASSTLLILNDAQQYAAAVPPPRPDTGSLPRKMVSVSQRDELQPSAAAAAQAGVRQSRLGGPQHIKADHTTQAASHLLPAAVQLCHVSLESLLLG